MHFKEPKLEISWSNEGQKFRPQIRAGAQLTYAKMKLSKERI
jgi:hypothetical protein